MSATPGPPTGRSVDHKKHHDESNQDGILYDECNVFVKYLPPDLSDSEFHRHFKPYGTIVSSKIMLDQSTGKSLGYGFVRYNTPASAQKAIQQMNGTKLHTKRLLCKLANLATQTNSGEEMTRTVSSHQTPSDNLYVKPLPQDTTEEQLRVLFGQFGKVTDCKVMIDRATGQSRQIGFVRFEKQPDAARALEEMNNKKIGSGPPLVVKYADTKEQKNARKYRQKNPSKSPPTHTTYYYANQPSMIPPYPYNYFPYPPAHFHGQAYISSSDDDSGYLSGSAPEIGYFPQPYATTPESYLPGFPLEYVPPIQNYQPSSDGSTTATTATTTTATASLSTSIATKNPKKKTNPVCIPPRQPYFQELRTIHHAHHFSPDSFSPTAINEAHVMMSRLSMSRDSTGDLSENNTPAFVGTVAYSPPIMVAPGSVDGTTPFPAYSGVLSSPIIPLANAGISPAHQYPIFPITRSPEDGTVYYTPYYYNYYGYNEIDDEDNGEDEEEDEEVGAESQQHVTVEIPKTSAAGKN